jgi:anaerobic selenocysteine-containing dehydrogenase
MEEFLTACPRNCYSTCSFRVQVENDRIIRILPYSGNLTIISYRLSIDPLRTPTADKADILFSPKPGTDGALALAIARVLIDNDLNEGGGANRLIARAETDIGFGAAYHDNRVEIEGVD